MIKTLSAFAISAFIAAALFVLPGFAPPVEAEGPIALQKSSRLVVHTVDRCAGQTWPNFSAACLYGKGAKLEPRLVSATAANLTIFMTSPAVRSDITFNTGCSAAIREEIGDRLRISLTGEPSGSPRHMTVLVEQIARTDGGRPYVAPEAMRQNAEVAQ